MKAKSKALWQGRADCLCGIYCALYVLRNSQALAKNSADRERRGLYWLLRAAEDLGILDAEHLAGRDGGFIAEEVANIFNHVPERFRMGYKAHSLNKLCPEFSGAMSDLISIFSAGGFAMIDVKNGKHWVLAHTFNSNQSANCFDPSIETKITSRKRASPNDGVIFVQRSRLVQP